MTQKFVGIFVAMLVGAVLGGVTLWGLVSAQTAGPDESPGNVSGDSSQVVNYGS